MSSDKAAISQSIHIHICDHCDDDPAIKALVNAQNGVALLMTVRSSSTVNIPRQFLPQGPLLQFDLSRKFRLNLATGSAFVKVAIASLSPRFVLHTPSLLFPQTNSLHLANLYFLTPL